MTFDVDQGTMINAEERSNNHNTAGNDSARAAQSMPKCVCTWKNCRAYQKGFRDGNHPVLDGVIRLKINKDDPDAIALKDSIDRTLRVSTSKRNDWRPGKRPGQEFIKYTLARHHFTEQHVVKWLEDKNFSFTKPLSIHGAKKYLFIIDPKETVRRDNESDLLYLQCPNVTKERVKAEYIRMKKEAAGKDQKDTLAQPSRKQDVTPLSPAPRSPGSTHSRNSRASVYDPLQQKEMENERLKEQLESMQGQLTFLHDMVRKLQEDHFDHQSVRSGRSSKYSKRIGSGHSRSSRLARIGVPNEIELGEEDEGDDDAGWNEPTEETEEDWTENDDDETESTFHATYPSGARVERRPSNGSVISKATSIMSASKSVKTLPREIELDQDEDDSGSHESLEDTFDNRSPTSSRHSRSVMTNESAQKRSSLAVKMPYRRQSNANSVSGHRKGQRRNSIGSKGKATKRLSIGSTTRESVDGSSMGTYHVTALVVTDPYGEQGTYTGSISNSTGMPHGYGRLEYDRAGRWYEGDWKHGRWTGQGRLSNGDGDYYEGGLKNDHKHGRGIMKFADGRTFEGEYVSGQMVQGTMTYQDGSTYSGSWVDGMRHGRGRCVFTDESVYEGEFREGEFFGYGKMSWNDGGWYEGEWWNGEMHGRGKEVRPDGTVRHEGEWSKGQPVRKK